MSDRSRRRLRTITIILATALVIAPAAALAGHQFNDVPASNVFHDDIDWMRDNDVTKGCNPPDNTEYCPDDFVTREQMAAFMHRLETEGVFLPADGKAADADTLDGKNSTAFLGVNSKAADADKLDGKNSAAFEQFGGTIPSGTTLTGNWYAAPSNGDGGGSSFGYFELTFPTTASAPADIGGADSNMAAGTAFGSDNDPQCTGTKNNPTAPAGKVCWYVALQTGLVKLTGTSSGDSARGASVEVQGDGTSPSQYARGTWAYTAP